MAPGEHWSETILQLHSLDKNNPAANRSGSSFDPPLNDRSPWRDGHSNLTRRAVCLSFAGAIAWPQLNKPVISVRTLNHMTLVVSNLKRSLEFFQGLFGMPVQARQENTVVLRIGPGPQFMALSEGGSKTKSAIGHLCMTTDSFDVARILHILAAHGVSRRDAGASGAGNAGTLSGGPMSVRVRVRRENQGGAKEGTPEIYVGDPDGLVVQLQHPSYCGGAGLRGDVCLSTPEPPPRKGLLAVRDLNHFTLYVSDEQRSRAFYQDLFGLPVRAYQGPTPIYRVGSGPQSIVMTQNSRANGATPGTPNIAHACLTMESFNPDEVLSALAQYGVKPKKDSTGEAGPLMSYVVMRRENRGGAKEGTPELYFTDPDGILLQLQHASYCGGSGYYGDRCS